MTFLHFLVAMTMARNFNAQCSFFGGLAHTDSVWDTEFDAKINDAEEVVLEDAERHEMPRPFAECTATP